MTSYRPSTLIVIDAAVADYQDLINNIALEARILVLDRDRDGVEQLTQALSTVEAVDQLHIVSHGSPGTLQLGSIDFNGQSLSRYAAQLKTWAKGLSGKAEILIYGCEVAAGAIGRRFIQQLKDLTGAEIAASKTLTGSKALGGNWNLEFATAPIPAAVPFSQAAIAAYPHTLATTLVSDTFRGQDVVENVWVTGIGTPVPGSPAPQQPILTARNVVAIPPGGIGGSPTGAIDAPGEGALRLTNNIADQAAFVLYNNPVPAQQGLTITFQMFAYGGTTDPTADGISFFLIDGATSPAQAGAFGGSLGYAQKTGIAPGIVGGFLGIGFDEYGNFSSVSDAPGGGTVRNGGNPVRVPDSISIRAGAATNYQFVTGTDTLPFGIDNPTATTREAAQRTVKIDLTPTGLLTVRIDGNNDGDFLDPGESNPNLTNVNIAGINGTSVPQTLKFGFASGTGNFNNYHEIRNLVLSTLNNAPDTVSFAKLVTPGSSQLVPGFAASDPDVADGDTIASYTILSLPDPSQGTLYIGNPANNAPVVAGANLTAADIQNIFFQATPGFTGSTFTYTATDARGESDPTPATVTLAFDDPNNLPPDTVSSSLRLPQNTAALVPGLSGTDTAPGSVAFFTVLTVPPARQGTLYLGDPAKGGTPIAAGKTLTPAELQQVYFKSSPNFQGGSFTYAATDNQGKADPTPAVVRLTLNTVLDPELCEPGKKARGNSKDNNLKGTRNLDTLRGLKGDDRLRGLDCNDRLFGARGNDRLSGGKERDRLEAGQNKDFTWGNDGDDVINLGLGSDFGSGGKGIDILYGRRGNDRMRGKYGDDNLYGGRDRDRILGGANNDFVDGQQGNDTLNGNNGRDIINGGLGDDKLRSSRKRDVAYGRRGNDVVWGGSGRDVIYGNLGNDRLSGNQQTDRLRGGGGDDIITGGGGDDRILTGGGSDRIRYKSANQGVDQIIGFSVKQDVIDLTKVFQNRSVYTKDDRFAAYVKLLDGATGAVLKVDANGNEGGGFLNLAVIQNVNANSLSEANFLV